MISKIAQFVYDLKLKQSTQTSLYSLKNRMIDSLYYRLERQNLLVETFVGKSKLQIPFSHQLPFILKAFPHYSTNLARIAKFVHEKYFDLKFIDIGANIGDSVALLRTESVFPILCIEGDDYFFSILETNADRFSDIHLAKDYVGESTDLINVMSVEVGGTAHLSHTETIQNTVHIKKLSTILADNQLFQKSKMIKVDTDGFDNQILRGSVDFLEDAKPIIFFEYDPFFLEKQKDDGLSIFDTLDTIGYQKLLIYENTGEFLLSTNLNNKRLLEDVNHFYTGRKGRKYCDICVFHEDDNDLFEIIRKSEMLFFENLRT